MKKIKLINHQGIKQIGYNMNTYQSTQILIKLTISDSHKNVEHLDLFFFFFFFASGSLKHYQICKLVPATLKKLTISARVNHMCIL